jgi:hypothetical protein
MDNPGLSRDQIAAFVLLGIVVLAFLGLGFSYFLEWIGLLKPPVSSKAVKSSAAAAPDLSMPRPAAYGKQSRVDDGHDPVFRPSPREAEAEVKPEVIREVIAEGTSPLITLTEKALQQRDADHIEDGMIKAFAAMQKGGYLVEGKATEVKRLLFGAAGGRKLQRLNAAIDAVAVPPAVVELPERGQLVVRDGGQERLIER